MEQGGNERSCVLFYAHKAITLTENYKVAYELWRERNPDLRTNIDAKVLLNQKNYILKNKKLQTLKLMR
jgi:hypothetical protein